MSTLYHVFEKIYKDFNKRRYVHPDPLEFLYLYDSPRDREIVGFIASALAYGRVQQILKSVATVIEPMGDSPFEYIMNSTLSDHESLYSGFTHRFTTEGEICHLLEALKQLYLEFGSMENFLSLNVKGEQDLISSLDSLILFLENVSGMNRSSLLSRPARGSACKRHFLFLKWMTRRDEVDPGGWKKITPDQLIMPVDTHIFSIAGSLRMTRYKQANLKAAVEITKAFRTIVPHDPTKYDFVLTRFGIRSEMKKTDLLRMCSIPE